MPLRAPWKCQHNLHIKVVSSCKLRVVSVQPRFGPLLYHVLYSLTLPINLKDYSTYNLDYN